MDTIEKEERLNNQIINFLADQKDGQSIEAIEQVLSQSFDRRTLKNFYKSNYFMGIIQITPIKKVLFWL